MLERGRAVRYDDRQPGNDVDFLGAVRRRWWLLAVATVLAGGVGAAVTHFAVLPTYVSSATLIVSPNPEVSDGGTRNRALDAYLPEQSMTATFKQLALQPTVVAAAADRLQVPGSLLRTRIHVKVVQSTPLIELTATAPEAQEAARLARGYTDALLRTTRDQRWVPELSLDVVSTAQVPASPSSPQPLLNTAAAGLAGLALAVCLVLLMEPRYQRGAGALARVRAEHPPAYLIAAEERSTEASRRTGSRRRRLT